jgi:hypothetical protein
MDDTNGAERDQRRLGLPAVAPISAARLRREVLRAVPQCRGSWRSETVEIAGAQSESDAFAERWVRSVKEECLSKLILIGEASLRRVLCEYVELFHAERNYQGNGNVILFPATIRPRPTTAVWDVESDWVGC